jgi:hypothetical protein
VIDRALTALGVDPVQCRALTATYLRMDMRRTGGAVRPREERRFGGSALSGLLIINVFTSIALAFVTAILHDLFTAAVLLTTYCALNIALLLLVDFTGLVVSPDDYRVLGSRPIESRTYFTARLGAVLVYVVAISLAQVFLPGLAVWFWRGHGVAGFAALGVAVVLCNACTTVLVIVGYTSLVSHIHPRRLSRALSYLQLAASTLFFGGYYLVNMALQHSAMARLAVRDTTWVWLDPAAWFAALVPLAVGSGGRAEAMAVAAAVAVTAVSLPVAAGGLSLEYAERLAEISAASEPARASVDVMTNLPGFARGEARAVALLIRAQFRYDMRFRLAVLALLPVTGFYILFGVRELLSDPFAANYSGRGGPMYFAIVFLPMTLHSALMASDSWRAAWIFFTTPADPARLIAAAKNFVAVWFLGGYLALLGLVWIFVYEAAWHAIAHAAMVWLVAHMLLQGAVIVHPALPFASEPLRAQRSAQLFWLFLLGGLAANLLPAVLPAVYAKISSTGIFFLLLAAATVALEYLLRRRARRAMLELEFRS